MYPEGHRYKGTGTLQLKTGVMEVAYNLKVPCQIVLSSGKEGLMDEISLKINRNAVITICVSDVLDPTKFKTKEEWFDFVKAEWEKTYLKLQTSETDGTYFEGSLPGIKPEDLGDEALPPKRRWTAIAYTVGILAIVLSLTGVLVHCCVC